MTAPTQDSDLRQGGRALLLALYATLRSLKLYPVDNATVQKALDELTATADGLFDLEPELDIRLASEFLFVNATRLRLELDNYAAFSHIVALFRAFEIGVVRIQVGVTRREWQAFTSALLRSEEPSGGVPADPLGNIQRRLAANEVHHIEVDAEAAQGLEVEEQRQMAKRAYAQGVAVTRELVASVRLGRASSAKRVKRAVQAIVDQVLNNETSLVGLTTIRDYDEYTFTHSVNVCIFAVALGKKLGFARQHLYDLGMTAILHDVGKARVPLAVLNKEQGLTSEEWALIQAHPWFGALVLFEMRGYDEIPYRSILVAHEHHMKTDLTGYPRTIRPRTLGVFSRLVAVADGFDAGTTRRAYQTSAMEPDEVLREMWENPRWGYDPLLVKALISLLGIYPVGTCVILDTLEVAIVAAVDADPRHLNRPWVYLAVDTHGAVVPPSGERISLAERDERNAFRRSIVKVTNPVRHGLVVGDYFL